MNVHSLRLLFLCLLLIAPLVARADDQPKYKDASAPVEDRVNDLLSRMTMEEKITLIAGKDMSTLANGRLGIPAILTADGRLGFNGGHLGTAYPAGIGLAASWDREVAAKFGDSLGREGRARGICIWLAPMIDMYRTPVGGRNFECGGEDPCLVSSLAVPEVKAVQARGVMATAVIFCCNDQDFGHRPGLDRNHADSIVDDRTLNEIYFPPFKALVDQAHIGAFMASYNLINGEHSAQNHHLLTDILENDWGFQGFVMSDWGATHDGIAAANAGLDLEMPLGDHMNAKTLLPAIASGAVKPEVIDDKVRRLLREFFTFGFFDQPRVVKSLPPYDPQGDAVALEMAREEMVLLKNSNSILPLDRSKIHSIAVIGPNADPAVCSGSGSSYINPPGAVSVLAGVKALAGPGVEVTTVPWRQFEPVQPPPEPLVPPVRSMAELTADSVAAAKKADVAVLCVGFRPYDVRPRVKDSSANEGEGADRTYNLPAGQAQLIQAVVAANPRTIVILNAGGGVDWSGWLDATPALIHAWYPGQEGGRALAEILFGDVNPSGKLPITLEKKWDDVPSSQYYDHVEGVKAVYGEGVFAGYRGFDQNQIEPQFPFGFGLSYTTFAFSNLQVNPTGDAQNPKVTLSFDVKNTGAKAGAEVGEVYVGDPHASVPRPPRELKGFDRVQLAPGESKTIHIDLDRDAFCFYDVASKSWKFEPGDFVIEVGPSSRELPLEKTVKL